MQKHVLPTEGLVCLFPLLLVDFMCEYVCLCVCVCVCVWERVFISLLKYDENTDYLECVLSGNTV